MGNRQNDTHPPLRGSLERFGERRTGGPEDRFKGELFDQWVWGHPRFRPRSQLAAFRAVGPLSNTFTFLRTRSWSTS